MLFEILFIILFTLLLVTLLVPVGGYGIYRDRFSGRPVSVEEEPDDVGAGVGIGVTMLFFFFIIFPLILAGSAWIGPRGPAFMGVSWGPILAIGIILALMLAAILPRRPRAGRQLTEEDKAEAATQEVALGVFSLFFFLFLIFVFAAVLFSYR